MKKLSDNISYLESSDNPLSAEVVMIMEHRMRLINLSQIARIIKLLFYHIFMLIMLKMRLDLMFLFIVLNIH